MNNLKIIAKTEEGKKAINQHISESHKQKLHVKIMFKQMGYHQELINTDPLTLEITLKNKRLGGMIKKEHFVREITEALKLNGAIMDIDYSIEAK